MPTSTCWTWTPTVSVHLRASRSWPPRWPIHRRAAERTSEPRLPRPTSRLPLALRRATRYNVRLPVRYRPRGGRHWRLGVTTNLSRTGMLFRTALADRDGAPGAGTPLEVILEVPGRNGRDGDTRVHRHATAVRTIQPETSQTLPALAVACSTDLWGAGTPTPGAATSHMVPSADAATAPAGDAIEVDAEAIQHLSEPDSLDVEEFSDGFAWLVSVPELPLTVLPEPDPLVGIRRARRFAAQIPVRYRLPDDRTWSHGVTENISHSGLLLQADRAAADLVLSSSRLGDGLPVQVLLDIPSANQANQAVEVRCEEGRLMRTTTSTKSSRRTSVAVAIRQYRVDVGPARGSRS